MKKLIIIAGIIYISIYSGFSQTSSDALKYSRIFYGGTARFQGLGGAFGAVGADFSVAATNPAGLGLYSASEISISPDFFIGTTSTQYNGVNGSDNRFNFALNNIGFVFNVTPKNNASSGFKSFNIAFGMNRQNDFNNRLYISGNNNANSILTDYSNILNSQTGMNDNLINDKYPFNIALARNTELIYYDSLQKKYTCDAPNGGVYQEKSVYSHGSINEFEISFGGNWSDKIYFGVTLGVPVIRYYEDSWYDETKTNQSIPYFRQLEYAQTLETHGTGFNVKAGLIYRPVNWFRIGAAIHTPTWYGNMRDQWSSSMYARFDSVLPENTQYSPSGYFNYQIRTPFRAIGSVAFIIGQYGLVSGEYEYVNYSQARFQASGSSFKDVNDEISNSYSVPVNVRVGTEWRIMNFRLRGGFGYYGSPYASGINNGECYMVSGGFGYRGKYLFTDLTYVGSWMKQDYYLYDPALVNPAQLNIQSYSVVLTCGVRF